MYVPLEEALCRRKFGSDDELKKKEVQDWLQTQSETLYLAGISKLTDCCIKCSENKDDLSKKLDMSNRWVSMLYNHKIQYCDCYLCTIH
jgi:hypothetical protein